MTGPFNFPIPAEELIPHRPPIRFIDHLLAHDGLHGVVQSILLPGSIFLLDDGSIEQAAMVELIAQSFAAVKGYSDFLEGKSAKKGFLVGVKRFTFQGTTCGQDRVLIDITKTGEMDEFALAEGRVTCGGEVLASGNVTVWLPREI